MMASGGTFEAGHRIKIQESGRTNIVALGQREGLLQSCREIILHEPALNAPAEEVRLDEFAERGRVFREAARASQLAGKAAEWIIRKIGDGFRQGFATLALSVRVDGMHPCAAVKEIPELTRVELVEVGKAGNCDCVLTFVM